jgi:hypothetical protein
VEGDPVADLLECVIQIKGTADTPRRLAQRARACAEAGHAGVATEVAARLALADARFSSCLSAMLAQEGPTLPSLDLSSLDVDPGRSLADWLAEFGWRRQAIVARLDRCSAADLGRLGFEPSRGPMTVADLVALMLAHDTDQLGRLIRPGSP